MKKLRHPNVIQLVEVLSSTTRFFSVIVFLDYLESLRIFLIFELAVGGELFQQITNQQRFSENLALRYFQQLLDGVEYCHSCQVCHRFVLKSLYPISYTYQFRDLKPENLLLGKHGELKISDFGLCALSDKEHKLKTPVGTPNYSAPEVCSVLPCTS